MKVFNIVKKYELDEHAFELWLEDSRYQVKFGLTGSTIDDSYDVDDLVKKFKQNLAEESERLTKEKEASAKAENEKMQAAAKAENEKKQAMASMLITSGFNFDGHTIKKYSGYISGDSALSMDRPTQSWSGGVNKDVGEDLLAGLAKIRRKALEELKDAAYLLGCNAVIGVDFDYITMDPQTATKGGGTLYLPFLFAVTANGNAVVIEKN